MCEVKNDTKLFIPRDECDESSLVIDLSNDSCIEITAPVETIAKNYQCSICHQQFPSKSSLNFHFPTHAHERPYVWEICDETEAEDCADHYSQHEKWVCFTCEKIFQAREELVQHQQMHRDDLSNEHTYNTFSQSHKIKKELEKHYRRVYMCDTCNKYFTTRSNLNRHVLIHEGLKSHRCKVCGQTFTQRINLQRHYYVHSNLKPYVCGVCDKGFSLKNSLTVHLLNHEGKKPFQCFICGRRFANRRNFKRHSLEHIPGQTRACGVCGKVFATSAKLKLHSLVHTNERPYKCDLCKRGFTYSSHLKRHQLWHSGERPYGCICGAAFIAKFLLTRHTEKCDYLRSIKLSGDDNENVTQDMLDEQEDDVKLQ